MSWSHKSSFKFLVYDLQKNDIVKFVDQYLFVNSDPHHTKRNRGRTKTEVEKIALRKNDCQSYA